MCDCFEEIVEQCSKNNFYLLYDAIGLRNWYLRYHKRWVLNEQTLSENEANVWIIVRKRIGLIWKHNATFGMTDSTGISYVSFVCIRLSGLERTGFLCEDYHMSLMS